MHRSLGRPWVADCRDPWRANPYRRMRYQAHEAADRALERRMVVHAHTVVCNTPAVMRDFASRFKGLAGKFRTVTNGYDAGEIAAAVAGMNGRDDRRLRLVHAGTFYGPRSPVPLFEAISTVLRGRPDLRGRLRLVQVGGEHYEQIPLCELARRCGVAESLELTGPLGHRERWPWWPRATWCWR